MAIYVIGEPAPAPGPVKIGTAQDVQDRLRILRSSVNPGAIIPGQVNRPALEILFECPGNVHLERALHHQFREFRIEGEWFALDPAVAPREVRMAIREMPYWRHVVDPSSPRPSTAHPSNRELVKVTGVQSVQHEPQQPEPPSVAEQSARAHYRAFQVWQRAGFTEAQALRLVAEVALREGVLIGE